VVALAIATATVTATANPIVTASFAGSDLNNGIALTGSIYAPPDSCGAVGPAHFVEFINGIFAIYDKTSGLFVTRISDQKFWQTKAGFTTAPAQLSDTRILYDPLSQRWFASEITVPGSLVNNTILLARSDTSDPTGTWSHVTLASASNRLVDFPTLGLNASGVYLTTDDFTSGGNTLAGMSIYSIPKVDLLAATPSVANASIFHGNSTASFGEGVQPVVDFAPVKTSARFIGASTNVYPGTTTVIHTATLTGTGAAGATLSAASNITVPTWRTAPNGAPQPDGTFNIDNGDGRFSQRSYQVGDDIWVVHPVDAGAANNDRSALAWYRISDSAGTLVASGTFADPSYDFYNPSIAANAAGDVVINFTRSGIAATGAAGDCSAMAMVGTTSGTTTTFGSPIMLKQGLADNYHLFGSTPERWGDYSAVTVDPANSNTFWLIQQYTLDGGGTTTARWGNWISAITVPEPATLCLLVLGAVGLLTRRRRKS
jgi:hypothetical protein